MWTGMPFRTEVPDNGSMARSSLRTFEFTPAPGRHAVEGSRLGGDMDMGGFGHGGAW